VSDQFPVTLCMVILLVSMIALSLQAVIVLTVGSAAVLVLFSTWRSILFSDRCFVFYCVCAGGNTG